MTKLSVRSFSASILLILILTPFHSLCAVTDTTKIIAISRHTFRGINKKIGPQKIALEDFGILIKTLPILSWGEDSTPRGQEIARQHASVGLQKAAEVAVKALEENKTFDGNWDEIRTDLATERTLWTALRIREGLKLTTNISGCPTQAGEPLDVLVSREPVMKCAKKDIRLLLNSSPDLALFKQRADNFLSAIRKSLNIKDAVKELPPATFDEEGKLPKEYDQIASLASAIEMSAELAPPLNEIFPGSDSGQGKQVVEAALNFLGIRFFINNPEKVCDPISLFPLKYMEDRKPGTHTLLVSHDDSISALLRALNIISSKSEPEDLAVYPIDTIVFAFGDAHVSVVRMRIQVQESDGFIPGPYANKVLWKGTLDEWNQKVKTIKDRAEAWKISPEARACISDLSQKVCPAEVLDVRY